MGCLLGFLERGPHHGEESPSGRALRCGPGGVDLEERLSTMTDETPRFAVTTSRQFVSWLSSTGASLAVTTYQSGKILLFGTKPTGGLAIFERTLDRPMGLAVSGPRLAVASLTQIVTFVDAADDGMRPEGPFDAVYIPQVAHFTGDLDTHDLAFDPQGRILFVNTLFSCLSRVSESRSFTAIWKPPFTSRLAAEDRCHLNGLALKDGRPAFATAVATTDVTDGWREHRRDGGVIVDIASGAIACAGLSMPHSPRWHEGRLYVLNSGTGEFGRVDPASGHFEPIAALLVELFPARIRYTSMSLPYHIGNGWFGGFLPTTAFAIVAARGGIYDGLMYPIAVAGVCFVIGLLLLPETRGRPLD